MKKRKMAAAVAFIMAVSLLLSGCGFQAASELLALPAQPAEYSALQSVLDAVIDAGAEYSAPVSGSRKQSVQMVDLDGDGTEEAVGFFKTTEEKPLKVYIFKQSGDSWETAAIIDGEGTAFDCVEYPKLSDNESVFLVIGWQISGDFTCAMSVYSLKDYSVIEIGNFNYDEYEIFDADSDLTSEIFTINLSGTDQPGTVDMFKFTGAAMESVSQTTLSKDIGTIKVIKTGYLRKYSPALFIMSTYGDGYITDIITYTKDGLSDIARNKFTGVSNTIVSSYYFARDINNDMITEVPIPKALDTSDTLTNSSGKCTLQWYNFDENSNRSLVVNTYQSDSDGWYLDFTGLDSNIVVNRSETTSGETFVTFYYQEADDVLTEFLTIYTLTGDNRYSRAIIGRRFKLMESGDKVYAARLPQLDETELEAEKQEIINRFHLLTYDWDTGEVG